MNVAKPPANDDPQPPPLHPERLTWAALLSRWVDFAKSALVLPDDEPGRRLRRSVPDIIMLQAVWYALRNLGDLADDEHALGLDRAELLIRKHADAIAQTWPDAELPEQITELIRDARDALRAAQHAH